MSTENTPGAGKAAPLLTLDTWAVLLALAATILIRLGVIPRVPW